jgi:hypothetical protein
MVVSNFGFKIRSLVSLVEALYSLYSVGSAPPHCLTKVLCLSS